MSTVRAPFLLLAAETTLSGAFMLCFCRAFQISAALVAVHVSLSLAVFILSLLVPGLFLYSRQVRESRIGRYLLALVPAITFAAIGLLYATDFSSYFWTGNNINYKLLWLYLNDWRHGGELISLSRSIYLSVIVFVLFVFSVHIGVAGSVFRGLENLLLPSRLPSLFRDRRRAIKSAMVITLLVLAYGLDLRVLSKRSPYSEMLSSDPFLSFVRSTAEVYDPNYDAFASNLIRTEKQCRSNYSAPQKFEKKNVIIITVDALRADHTGVYGYERPTTPFLQSLVDSGRLRKVEFATSTCSGTFCGIMSTLASKNLKELVPGVFKLYDLLSDQGYKSYLILSGSHDIQGLRESYGREMTFYFDGQSSKQYPSEDDRLIFEGLEHVPDFSGTPAFFYFHLMAVHLIGTKQESFNLYQPVAERPDFRAMFRGESVDWAKIVNSYDNSVMQADATIKKIFEALEYKGYLRNSVVVILADHGEGLGERAKYGWGHGHWLNREFIQIPLLIYDDPKVKYQNSEFATQIDVAPTIVDRLGLAIPPCWHGTSLLKQEIRQASTHQTSLSRPCYAVVYRADGTMYEYIHCSVGETEELYDLTRDPKEQTNLIGSTDASLVGKMRDELKQIRQQ